MHGVLGDTTAGWEDTTQRVETLWYPGPQALFVHVLAYSPLVLRAAHACKATLNSQAVIGIKRVLVETKSLVSLSEVLSFYHNSSLPLGCMRFRSHIEGRSGTVGYMSIVRRRASVNLI
jgi:hypothetical protein